MSLAERRIGYLDGLRALAASFVVLHHAYLTIYPESNGPKWLGFLGLGHYAVTVFIVLSGYSLSLSYRRHGTLPTLDFLRRRFRRIVLPYWVAFAISWVLATTAISTLTGSHWDVSLPVTVGGTIEHLLLIQDFSAVGNQTNHALWSVALEWHIYFVFPLVLFSIRRFGLWPVAVVMLIATAALAESMRYSPYDILADADYLGCFILGVAACLVRDPNRRLAGFVALMVGGAFAVVVLAKGAGYNQQIFDVSVGIATAALLIWLPGTPLSRALSTPVLLRIGTISFSLYLIHAPLLQVVWQYLLHPAGLASDSPAAVLALCFVGYLVSLLAAQILYVLVERPAMPRTMRAAIDAEVSPGQAPASTLPMS